MSSAMIHARSRATADRPEPAVTLMVVISIACAPCAGRIGGPLAGAVKMEGLSTVLAALSVSVVLSIAAMGPRAILERSLRYQTVAAVEAGAADCCHLWFVAWCDQGLRHTGADLLLRTGPGHPRIGLRDRDPTPGSSQFSLAARRILFDSHVRRTDWRPLSSTSPRATSAIS